MGDIAAIQARLGAGGTDKDKAAADTRADRASADPGSMVPSEGHVGTIPTARPRPTRAPVKKPRG